MTGTAATGGSPRPAPDLPDGRRSEVNTVNTTDLQNLQPAALAVAPRPKAAIALVAAAPVCPVTTTAYGKTTGNGIAGSWLATTRLSMFVPAFHDRRPLCSTT
jgi:hypothetical protein